MDLTNNNVTIAGKIVAGFTYENEVCGEKFYKTDILVERLSGAYDLIPLMVSERIMDVKKNYKDCYIFATGQFRSYNNHEAEKNKLILYVFAREISVSEEIGMECDLNNISLDGYICKEPKYRETPLGREVTDVFLAVNRRYGKSDYIPCICWGRNARYADQFEVGAHVQLWGRIQSREYQKKIDEEVYEKRVAYEVSVSKLEYLSEE